MPVTRSRIALALAAAALFVAVGGPAYAADAVTAAISGKNIKAKSVGSKQLAKGAITLPKLSKSARKALTGPQGAAGAAGAPGADGAVGAKGATGPSGPYDVYDRNGQRIGRDVGGLIVYQAVLTDGGAILVYDADPTNLVPLPLAPTTLFYKQAGCAGTPYVTVVGGVAAQVGVTVGVATPGAPVFAPDRAPYENFTYQSFRSGPSCTNSSAAVTQMLPAHAAGTVPSLQKPLLLKAVG